MGFKMELEIYSSIHMVEFKHLQKIGQSLLMMRSQKDWHGPLTSKVIASFKKFSLLMEAFTFKHSKYSFPILDLCMYFCSSLICEPHVSPVSSTSSVDPVFGMWTAALSIQHSIRKTEVEVTYQHLVQKKFIKLH